MRKYILLLRGINVGGKNKVSMAKLKELFEKNGFYNVITYINSGNIIFISDSSDMDYLKAKCEELIYEKFMLKIAVFIIGEEELWEALHNAPAWWGVDKESKHNAIFVLSTAKLEEVYFEVGDIKPEYEKVGHFGRVIFWSAPIETFSMTRWSKVVSNAIYNSITIRNYNTVKKLVELCDK